MYTVVVLAEQALTETDASQVVGLHADFDTERRYHVVIPCENAAAQVEAALGSLAASEMLAHPTPPHDDIDIDDTQAAIDAEARTDVDRSVTALTGAGARADGEFTSQDPVHRLVDVVQELEADEVIVMTMHHVLQDFLHIDWASQARRKLGIPVLHLLEHEPFDAEAGAGEGASLL